jgi:spermidine synthase
LVVGLGSGFTAAGVLAAGAGPTEIVELEPGVVEASRFFHRPGKHPLDDPRARLIEGDARTHLAHGGGRYDLIVSEPTNPWIAGVNNLFTADFYRLVRARLDEDGVFCQWMQLYELSPEAFASMFAAFTSVFPRGQLFGIWRSVDLLLIAVPDGHALALDRLKTPAAIELLKNVRLSSPDQVASYWAAPLSAPSLQAVAASAIPNTDDRPYVEYRAPRDLVAIGHASPIANAEVRGFVPFSAALPVGPLFSAWAKSRWYDARARGLVEQGERARAEQVLQGARAAGDGEIADRIARDLGPDDASFAPEKSAP